MTDHDQQTILHWNVYMANEPERVADFLRRVLVAYQPQVVILNEAMRHHAAIRVAAKSCGYTFHGEAPRPRRKGADVMPEHGNTVALVHRDVHLDWFSTRPMRLRWTVWSHRQVHAPRRHIRLVFHSGRNRRWRITGDHWPTKGNTAAQAESAAFTARALVRGPRTVAVSVGDKNTPLATLRKRFPGMVRGKAPDAGLVTGGTITYQELGKGGSDHHAGLYTVTRKPRRRRR